MLSKISKITRPLTVIFIINIIKLKKMRKILKIQMSAVTEVRNVYYVDGKLQQLVCHHRVGWERKKTCKGDITPLSHFNKLALIS